MSWRTVFGGLSPAGERGRLSVLIFHRVLQSADPLMPDEVDAARFDALCGWLAAWFQVLPLDRAVRLLAEGRLPARALAITFDDGYADNEAVAMPILRRHGLSATFFVATGFLDGGRMWNDTVIEAIRLSPLTRLDLRGTVAEALGELPLDGVDARRAALRQVIGATKYLQPDERLAWVDAVARASQARLPDDLMMQSAQVQSLQRGGMTIGAHTVNHPILARLDEAAARQEIADSRTRLEALIGERVGLFAYPNGKAGTDYLPANVATVRDLGFDAAVATDWGAARTGDDLFQLPRFTPWDRQRHRFAARLARNLMGR